MTVPRILVGVAVLLGLLSTGLGKTMRLEKAHGQAMSAPSWLGESAPLDTNRLALVIGNSNYPDADSPLPQMTRDAEGLTNALRKNGFLVGAVHNATRGDMTRAIDDLRARVHLNSIVLIYFGGYGVQSDGQNYLIPVDAKIWYEEDVRRQGVSIDLLLSKLKTSGARVRLVVVEASRRKRGLRWCWLETCHQCHYGGLRCSPEPVVGGGGATRTRRGSLRRSWRAATRFVQ
jgi:hypothetical protein